MNTYHPLSRLPGTLQECPCTSRVLPICTTGLPLILRAFTCTSFQVEKRTRLTISDLIFPLPNNGFWEYVKTSWNLPSNGRQTFRRCRILTAGLQCGSNSRSLSNTDYPRSSQLWKIANLWVNKRGRIQKELRCTPWPLFHLCWSLITKSQT